MEKLRNKAYRLLHEFKGNSYINGTGCLKDAGGLILPLGKKVSVVAIHKDQPWAHPVNEKVLDSLTESGISLAGEIIESARPNAPVEDVLRIAGELRKQRPEAIISIGGGSSLDATKAANAYLVFSDINPNLNDYFGAGTVSRMIESSGRKLLPMAAVQVSSSSAAHLTKYSNITDMVTMQKMLIIDEAIVPARALYDYSISISQPTALTLDGGLDGISHCLEVYLGCPETMINKAEDICLTGIELIVNNLGRAVADPSDLVARESIGLGTDLGGYAIMVGGTSGAHLNSFSMVDILTHGRAVALMNPYYVVFFADAVEDKLRKISRIYKDAGYIKTDLSVLKGRKLGTTLAEGMMNFSGSIGFPATLQEVPGFTDAHIERCLTAARNPKLDSKLKNMPVPLSASMVDDYMKPILLAAKTGNLDLIRSLKYRN